MVDIMSHPQRALARQHPKPRASCRATTCHESAPRHRVVGSTCWLSSLQQRARVSNGMAALASLRSASSHGDLLACHCSALKTAATVDDEIKGATAGHQHVHHHHSTTQPVSSRAPCSPPATSTLTVWKHASTTGCALATTSVPTLALDLGTNSPAFNGTTNNSPIMPTTNFLLQHACLPVLPARVHVGRAAASAAQGKPH